MHLIKPAVVFLTLLALTGCENPWVYPTLAEGGLDTEGIEIDADSVLMLTATVPADALPASLEEGWSGYFSANIDGWSEDDSLTFLFTDCDDTRIDEVDSTELDGAVYLGVEAFSDCAPDQDCVRTFCVDIAMASDTPVVLNGSAYATVNDNAAYNKFKNSGQKQLAEHPVQQPFLVGLVLSIQSQNAPVR